VNVQLITWYKNSPHSHDLEWITNWLLSAFPASTDAELDRECQAVYAIKPSNPLRNPTMNALAPLLTKVCGGDDLADSKIKILNRHVTNSAPGRKLFRIEALFFCFHYM
jgi:hypothetical protein